MSWSPQRRCGPPLRSQTGCGRCRSGCCSRRDLPGPGRRWAHGVVDAQGRTNVAEASGSGAVGSHGGEPDEPDGTLLVVIPTYNERDNLEPLLARLHVAAPQADVL